MGQLTPKGQNGSADRQQCRAVPAEKRYGGFTAERRFYQIEVMGSQWPSGTLLCVRPPAGPECFAARLWLGNRPVLLYR